LKGGEKGMKKLLDFILDKIWAFKNRNRECGTISVNFIIPLKEVKRDA